MLITPNTSKFFKRKHTIQLDGEIIDLKDPIVMGILNLSPDSFYDGGKYKSEKKILARAEEILEQGATFIDIGAVSTRPGSMEVSTKTEMDRLLPAVRAIRKRFPQARLSVDTFRSWVALRIFEECGPCVVNDVTGGSFDVNMFQTIGSLEIPYILTHISGTPTNMQDEPEYDDVVKEIASYFTEKVKRLTKCGVKDVILDPGFGFGKTLEHNYELLNRLDAYKVFQLPLLVGVSRKSMIYNLLEKTPAESLNGTTVINTLSLIGGADILRVHDVKEAMEAVCIFKKLKEIVD